ncbi:MAG: hypothetical protein HY898_00605 [Deltaproteobacteria bacterium]|nr:hypothetical protein [Deltaproteobacteria bacterium]
MKMAHRIEIALFVFRCAVCLAALGLAGLVAATACTSSSSPGSCPAPLTVAFDGGPNDFLTPVFDASPVPGQVGSHGTSETCSRICPVGRQMCTLVSSSEVRCEQMCY